MLKCFVFFTMVYAVNSSDLIYRQFERQHPRKEYVQIIEIFKTRLAPPYYEVDERKLNNFLARDSFRSDSENESHSLVMTAHHSNIAHNRIAAPAFTNNDYRTSESSTISTTSNEISHAIKKRSMLSIKQNNQIFACKAGFRKTRNGKCYKVVSPRS